MTAPRPWSVYRPRPLTQRSPSVWTVDDDVPGLPGADRRMSIIRRSDGSLVFFNAIPVADETLAQVKALGTPAHLLLPNQYHALDAAAFVERLGVTAWAPDVAVSALASRVACQPVSAFPAGPDLRLITVEGFVTKEFVLLVADTLFMADLVTNAPHGTGVMGLVMRLVGFTGPSPKLPKPVRRRVQRDREAVKSVLLELASLPGVTRLIPSHGGLVEGDVAAVLRQVAAGI